MNLILLILAALIVTAFVATAGRRRGFATTLSLANDTPGATHPSGRMTLTVATGNTITEGMLVKLVSGEAVICGATDMPFGVAEDDADAGEIVPVAILGAATGTVRMIAGEAITAPAILVPTANGEVVALDADASLVSETRYYIVGHAVEDGTEDDTFEVAPTFALYNYTEDTVST